MEEGIFIIAFREIVVRDLGAQVVDVMKADVPTKPLQDKRQLVKRTALQPGLHKLPAFMVIPISGVKVMLDLIGFELLFRGSVDIRV